MQIVIPIIFKELLMRLSCFVLRPAAAPIVLKQPDDELIEDMETEDLMRVLSSKCRLAPRYRWRRSRWERYCPVAMAEGNLVQGKPEFAVSFLDKMYVLSSTDALGKFLTCPRRYLVDPYPRAPCKLVVLGPPKSGKTTLCNLLAKEYDAKVLDIDVLIKPYINKERERLKCIIEAEALALAISTVTANKRAKEKAERDIKLEGCGNKDSIISALAFQGDRRNDINEQHPEVAEMVYCC